jgi:hypothetical protein
MRPGRPPPNQPGSGQPNHSHSARPIQQRGKGGLVLSLARQCPMVDHQAQSRMALRDLIDRGQEAWDRHHRQQPVALGSGP